MPYIENETKAKLREIRSTAEPVFDGVTNKLDHYEVTKEHFHWLLGQVEKAEVKAEKLFVHCMNCDYETGSMCEKDLIFKISMDGGYIKSDKDGGYYSECPNCESESLSLQTT